MTCDTVEDSAAFAHADTRLPFDHEATQPKPEKRHRAPYVTWARQGLIEMTPGNVVDYGVICQRLNELDKLFKIREVAIDPWNATQLATQLDDDHFEVVQFGQGFQDMTSPTKELEKLVASGWLRHGEQGSVGVHYGASQSPRRHCDSRDND
ncbi:MAG: hypothetical protein J5J06_09440 [Phycisphaerae bacterium]|nr:hypothetical protein [Phycisphaerae bacterium]